MSKQRKHVLDFSWNPSWNLLEICSVKFVDTVETEYNTAEISLINDAWLQQASTSLLDTASFISD